MFLILGSHLKINPYAQQSSSPLSHNQGRNDNIHRHQKYDRRDKPYERRRSRSPDRRNNRNGGGRDRDQDNYNQERRGRY